MSQTGLTTMNVKIINKNKVYNYIYEQKTTSKYQIVQNLQMGLSTVGQNLKELEEEGLIERKGTFESTGGRKAQMIQIIPTARIAIGIGILKDMIHMVAIDLYGEVLYQTTVSCSYSQEESYYQYLGKLLTDFISENSLPEERILGVSIAAQGIISPDGRTVDYGVLMDNADMKLSDFEKYIPWPCRLEHDSKAAAYLELWNHKDLKNAVLFLLNRNLGGAIISEGKVLTGNHMKSGTLEHLCMNPDGPLCYCGNRGCLETYCSAHSLEKAAGMSLESFFTAVHESESAQKLWTDYLEHLAFAIRNLSILIDGAVILNGYLAPYICEDDITFLLSQINPFTPFPLSREQIIVGTQGQYAPAIGSALYDVNEFIKNI